MSHIGELHKDAGGLAVRLQNLLEADEIRTLVEVYREVFELGGCLEGEVMRGDGVSFNPRPARIAVLAIDEFNLTGLSEIGAGFCLSLPSGASFRMRSATLQMMELSSQARLLIDEGIDEPSIEVRHLASAFILDQVRHIHMTSLHFDAKREMLTAIEEKFLRYLQAPEMTNARTKIETALRMQLRRLS